jgi:hypothetical protein
LLLREKIDVAAPGEFSGRAYFSALRNFWRQLFTGSRTQYTGKHAALTQALNRSDQSAFSPELRGLLATLNKVRQRILVNTLLEGAANWSIWVLAALIVVAAASSRVAGELFFVGALAAIGAAVLVAWIWHHRPSSYESAQRLDRAAALKDRVSTAVFLGGISDPAGLIAEQRKDAVARAAKLEPRAYFPFEWPRNARRALVLLLIAAGLFVYRIHHRPLLVSLLENTVHSQLVQSMLSPIVHAMEKDLQRTLALVNRKPDAAGEDAQRADATSNTDDLWKADSNPAPAAEDKKDQQDAIAAEQEQDQMQTPGTEEGNPSGEPRQQQSSNSQSQEGKSGNENADAKSQQDSEQQGPEGKQSLGQSLMQALKNMLSNSPNQQSNQRAAQQPPNGQGTPQSGNSQQPGATESDKRGDSRGSSDTKQKATQTASEGAGSQMGNKELRKDQETHPVNAVPDRVALESGSFKDEMRMKVPTETGTAQLGLRDVSPQQDAVTNGAEQENIPARYRFYVQRYFEHADTAKQ